MAGSNLVRDEIRARLQEAVDKLRIQLTQVELWADALDGFSRPVPTYKPDNRYLLPPGQDRKH